MRIHHYVSALAALALVSVSSQPLAGDSKEATNATERAQASMTVLGDLTKAPDQTIPENLLSGAEGIVVIPTLVKGGFIVGAQHGRGVFSVRHSAQTREGTKNNGWSLPAFVKMTGGNIGWQIGLEQVDLVLLVMNRDGIDDLLADKFTMGGTLSVAAGPVGRTAAAGTDAKLQAGLLAYSRAKGLFAGATLDGSALHSDDDANRAVYQQTSLKTLLLEAPPKPTPAPPALRSWQQRLDTIAKR
jgi:lipid-binding SYLF domain-containing protein